MAQIVENDTIIQDAYRELARFSANPEMREKERRRQRYLADYNLSMGAAKAEGKAEGKAERDISIAQTMKAKGFSVADISDITGLSAAEVERLG